ncbi:MAG: portal protein [Symbiopectobacterium sp.]
MIAEFGKSTSLPTGINIRDDVRSMIHQAFYLNSLTLPDTIGMTAYEVSQHVQEYIRQATPLFSPMEPEYNGDLCDMTFNKLMWAGAFGSVYDIPESLQGEDVQFTFESPLQTALGQEKQGQAQAVAQILLGAAQLEQAPSSVNLDVNGMIRDAIYGSGAPAKWLCSKDEVAQIQQQNQAMQQKAAEVAQLQQGAQTVSDVANVAQSVQSLAGAA